MDIKKIIFSLLALFLAGFVHAQATDIFKSEAKVESPDFGNYNINVLFLYGDGTYKILWQRYSSKKMARKNILLDLSEENGTWSKKDEIMYLNPSTKKQKIKFRIKNRNKLFYIMDDGNTGSLWRAVMR